MEPIVRSVAIVAVERGQVLDVTGAYEVFDHVRRLVSSGEVPADNSYRPENLKRVFKHGFTTRQEGHGFGLYSSACAAAEMGGRLSCRSEDSGRGAVFMLK